jgi:pyrimidine operon attenuation protein/uracil phosphoribosyltransferase
MATSETVILDPAGMNRALTRIAHEILERNKGVENLALVGIRSGGDYLAAQLQTRISDIEKVDVPLGAVDITMYRDDLAARGNLPVGRTDIPFPLDGKRVVLVDDVLYTGRTIRAAMDALIDLGRPRAIQLAVLIDRGGRELPIQPNFAGMQVKVGSKERIDVLLREKEGVDEVVLGPA